MNVVINKILTSELNYQQKNYVCFRIWNQVSEQVVGAEADEEWHEFIKDFKVQMKMNQ